MKRARLGIGRWLPLLLLAGGGPAMHAQEKEAVVELPPMVVMESAKGPPWYYVRTAGGEYLSRCSVGTTREFVQADLKLFQLLRAFVPDSLNARVDIPATVVLDRLESKAEADSVMADMTRFARERAEAERRIDGPISLERVQMLLNLRLDDRDMSVLFAYLDDKNFDGGRMIITPGYLRFLLERRAPDLPSWYIEGAVTVFDRANFITAPITVRPLMWQSEFETASLVRDPNWPRALLPMNELFAPDALRAEEDHAPRRIATWRAEAALFVRWAMDPANDKREALWRLVERAALEPVTEEIFLECFGIGFAEMRDRLSDYLPTAVKESMRIDPGSPERIRIDEPRIAAREVTARILGEWQRLEIPYVAARHPEFATNFAQEARRTLRKAYDWGDRNPQLLAALGLCEIDAGNPDGAPFFLKLAIEQNVNRPRAYYEVARMRFADLTRSQPQTYQLSAAETETIVAPLRRGLQQKPLMPEAVALFANAWLRSAAPPNDRDCALLLRCAKVFPARPTTLYRIAAVHAKIGRLADAQELLAQALKFPVDEQLRTRIAELQTLLSRIKK